MVGVLRHQMRDRSPVVDERKSVWQDWMRTGKDRRRVRGGVVDGGSCSLRNSVSRGSLDTCYPIDKDLLQK